MGYVFGAGYVLIGLVGLNLSKGVDFAGQNGKSLLGFDVNGLHDIVHLLVGVLLLFGASRGTATARQINILVGAVYGLIGVLGLFIAGDHSANIIALNTADNALHLVSAALLLGVGLFADKGVDHGANVRGGY